MSKLELQMLAFCLNGYDEYIKLTIEEVFSYPDETSYFGGYDAKGSIEIIAGAGGYKVNCKHYFSTGELFLFKESLRDCYENLSGFAVLENSERELDLTLSFYKAGKVKISGCFQDRQDIRNRLEFEIDSDQSCILPVIKELTVVEKVFGDDKGIKSSSID